MLIPSIDLMGGRIVQLVQGERLKLAFDDFEYWIQRFSKYPMVQLIDLDAAMRQGENRVLIEQFAKRLPCQVGGGISSIARAEEMLAAGAKRVILGSALFGAEENFDHEDQMAHAQAGKPDLVRRRFASEICERVGRKRLVFSVDTKQGKVAVKGWREQVDLTPAVAMEALEPYCDAFLYTHVDKEGTMQGFPIEIAKELRGVTQRQLIVAGGIRDQGEIDALDAMRVDAVAGMAVYLGRLAT
jgi:phosphoribosylformimino-5-aminoimidazole carboxamide ribotide isomerase